MAAEIVSSGDPIPAQAEPKGRKARNFVYGAVGMADLVVGTANTVANLPLKLVGTNFRFRTQDSISGLMTTDPADLEAARLSATLTSVVVSLGSGAFYLRPQAMKVKEELEVLSGSLGRQKIKREALESLYKLGQRLAHYCKNKTLGDSSLVDYGEIVRHQRDLGQTPLSPNEVLGAIRTGIMQETGWTAGEAQNLLNSVSSQRPNPRPWKVRF